ncbi:hypothetical protein CHCC14820_2410 [Bacillus paralicheniformis]|jgi:hypothetical protein|uniref:Uncharacterized protein n=1 Tax=Bacillus paralicheniformis TaxID=1648923 RepID=A0A6I7U8S2_9BACI|nr:hypothetical protein SC10_B2orf01346 [Bacillus paralicheniformis]GIN78476.1 hypothetical protein J41TS8_35170 [Bacillus sp. J41TS8]OLF96449.1 hypothetical protein B4121_1071 [Bacillus paralicheniformis]OLF99651.1 hypothetical protein B4123_4713 [Bacillus paralicheniformis]OLG01099.1 hypothetical protein B4125_4350 [Bacillus paralicheniformis]
MPCDSFGEKIKCCSFLREFETWYTVDKEEKGMGSDVEGNCKRITAVSF